MTRFLLFAVSGLLLACSPPANRSADPAPPAATAARAPLADYVNAAARADMYEGRSGSDRF
jgi:hypothetical protein